MTSFTSPTPLLIAVLLTAIALEPAAVGNHARRGGAARPRARGHSVRAPEDRERRALLPRRRPSRVCGASQATAPVPGGPLATRLAAKFWPAQGDAGEIILWKPSVHRASAEGIDGSKGTWTRHAQMNGAPSAM